MITPEIIMCAIICFTIIACVSVAAWIGIHEEENEKRRSYSRDVFYYEIVNTAAKRGATQEELSTMQNVYLKYIIGGDRNFQIKGDSQL